MREQNYGNQQRQLHFHKCRIIGRLQPISYFELPLSLMNLQ